MVTKEEKEREIIKRVSKIPVDKWTVIKEENKRDVYLTIINEVEIKIVDRSMGWRPYIKLFDIEIYDKDSGIDNICNKIKDYISLKDEEKRKGKGKDNLTIKILDQILSLPWN